MMKLIGFKQLKDGKYLKNYELTYLNKNGKEKKYEIVSRNQLESVDDVGSRANGVSIIATMDDKMLLLKEFRMGVNRYVYNLCAGMLEAGETLEQCVSRELYEETGLKLVEITDVLKPSFAAVAISDTKTYTVFAKVTGTFEDHTSENELIEPKFFTKEELKLLLEEAEFSSRSQIAAYYFANS